MSGFDRIRGGLGRLSANDGAMLGLLTLGLGLIVLANLFSLLQHIWTVGAVLSNPAIKDPTWSILARYLVSTVYLVGWFFVSLMMFYWIPKIIKRLFEEGDA